MTGRVFHGSAKDLQVGDHVKLVSPPVGLLPDATTGIIKEVRPTYLIDEKDYWKEGVIIVFEDDTEWTLSSRSQVKLLL